MIAIRDYNSKGRALSKGVQSLTGRQRGEKLAVRIFLTEKAGGIMKKTLITGVFLALVGMAVSPGGAMAMPTGADYWTATDATTGVNGNIGTKTNVVGPPLAWAFAQIGFSYFNKDVVGSFGLYYDLDQDLAINPTTEHFQVVSGAISTPAEINNSTFFHFNSGSSVWEVASVDIWAPGYSGAATPMAFSNVFGFYFSAAQQPSNYFYTDASFNGGNEVISIDYSPFIATIHCDLNNDGTLDAVVKTDDVAPAPVPEPATMLLLGSGLIGLASASRKRRNMA